MHKSLVDEGGNKVTEVLAEEFVESAGGVVAGFTAEEARQILKTGISRKGEVMALIVPEEDERDFWVEEKGPGVGGGSDTRV